LPVLATTRARSTGTTGAVDGGTVMKRFSARP